MTKTMFCLFPYDKASLYAVRTNDDGTFSVKTIIGDIINEYGPQKKRFDLRQSKPYITTHDWEDVKETMRWIRVYMIGNWMDSIGFDYDRFSSKIRIPRQIIQSGYNDSDLFIVTVRERANDEIDCRVAVISLKSKTVYNPLQKAMQHRPKGAWYWMRYDEIKTLNENALTMIDRGKAAKMALEVFEERWESILKDFKDWCGVDE